MALSAIRDSSSVHFSLSPSRPSHMVPQPRSGSFTPNPSAQPIYTSFGHHSPHPSHPGALSAGASPSASSPTGSNSLTKIVVAQVYLLLSTIKEDKDDPHKWDVQTESLRKVCSAALWPPPFDLSFSSGSVVRRNEG